MFVHLQFDIGANPWNKSGAKSKVYSLMCCWLYKILIIGIISYQHNNNTRPVLISTKQYNYRLTERKWSNRDREGIPSGAQSIRDRGPTNKCVERERRALGRDLIKTNILRNITFWPFAGGGYLCATSTPCATSNIELVFNTELRYYVVKFTLKLW
jgi:hypothetical protein